MATFTTIALELRHEIYSYLLLVKNASEPRKLDDGPVSLIPTISTSLFTLNKQISNESLEYFYGQNEFVAVNALRHDERMIMRAIAPCFLCDSESQDICRDKVSLVIEFTHRSRAYPDPHSGILDLVCSAHDLPDYLRLLNTQHFCYGALERQSTVGEFHFSLGLTGYYTEGTADRLVKLLKEHLSVLLLRLKGDPRDIYTFSGKLDSERIAFLRSQPFERHSFWSSLGDCRCILNKADEASKSGRFSVAEGHLNSIYFLTGMYRRGMVKELLSMWEDIEIQTSIALAVHYGRAGKEKIACLSVAVALDGERIRKYGKTEPLQYAYLYFTLAGVLVDAKSNVPNLLAALELFRKALEHVPIDVAVADVREVIYREIRVIEFKLARLGVSNPRRLSIEEIIRQYPPESAIQIVP